MKPVTLIRAPSNLGLRPLRPQHEPGTWRAPAALTKAGLVEAISPKNIIDLPRPKYDPEPQPGTRIRNGNTLREFNLSLAKIIEKTFSNGDFAMVIGGDCSILLGCLAGVRRHSQLSLVHIDGHSDFRHPGNYDFATAIGAAAGMDLALATGRGETLMTEWPGVASPLVPDSQAIQIGERDGNDPNFAWPDVNATAITRIDVFTAKNIGPKEILARAQATLERQPQWPFWIHFDVDVLDQTIMPAVDSPGSPGIDPGDLKIIFTELIKSPRCAGLSVTVFDPDLDPDEKYAQLIVDLLRQTFAAKV
jgi:arginase